MKQSLAAVDLTDADLTPVFVYGTLLTGMRNAGLVLQSAYLGDAWIEGYALYDLGSYPAILAAGASERVLGELRLVDAKTLEQLNELEDEGSLYRAERVHAHVGDLEVEALAYVYLHDVDPASRIPLVMQPYSRHARLKQTHVWYVCYGSNLLFERIMLYIAGGFNRLNSRKYDGCDDTTPPLACCPFDVPYDLYYARNTPIWGGGGYGFLDFTHPGRAYGRAYLVTREQYEQLLDCEGRGPNNYNEERVVGRLAGIDVITFSNSRRFASNPPGEKYLDVIRQGLIETRPDLSREQIEEYLQQTISR